MVRGFAQQHPVWFGAVGLVGSAVGATLLGAVGLLLGFLFAAALLLEVGLRAWAWPGNRRRRTANRIRERIRELRVRDSLTPVIERARYASRQNAPPEAAQVHWRGTDVESSEVSAKVLEPLRQVLKEQGQPHLAALLSFRVAVHPDDSPADLGWELGLLASLVAQLENAPEDSLFKIGRFGGTSARA